MIERGAGGVDHAISAGEYEARVASVGASLRSLRYRGRDLVAPFPAGEMRPAMRGAVLAPWPNRLADGRYRFGGEEHQLPLSEPEFRNAAHGLVAWQDFEGTASVAERLVLTTHTVPQPGYPWRIRLDVEFTLSPEAGLRQRIVATNESDAPAPVGLGAHPYLAAGPLEPSAVDGWTLQLPAAEVMLVSSDRLLPVGVEPVGTHEGGVLDFRSERRIGATELNHAFTALERNGAGEVVVRLVDDDGSGSGVQLTTDAGTPWLQVYSADGLPPESRRHALAIEPMTCPPDAFNSGCDLRILVPGESTALEWSVKALD
ncbi:aldose 1-epimerase family protein [Herbiconiux sp.]|uniref:aldose 1-epimerase family protein n=1 Tax=Herbiconiux sp. TaxID=1871186 RepID=UPI0025C59D60|nr:aldose 1-epimerase family protein [Herbiconiux sp.]